MLGSSTDAPFYMSSGSTKRSSKKQIKKKTSNDTFVHLSVSLILHSSHVTFPSLVKLSEIQIILGFAAHETTPQASTKYFYLFYLYLFYFIFYIHSPFFFCLENLLLIFTTTQQSLSCYFQSFWSTPIHITR